MSIAERGYDLIAAEIENGLRELAPLIRWRVMRLAELQRDEQDMVLQMFYVGGIVIISGNQHHISMTVSREGIRGGFTSELRSIASTVGRMIGMIYAGMTGGASSIGPMPEYHGRKPGEVCH